MVFSTIGNKLANVFNNVTRKDAVETKQRKDSWVNPYTNIGVPTSRVESTRYIPELNLNMYMLTALYKSDGIAKRIVNIIVDDALRNFIECDNLLKNELDRVKAKQNIIDAASWARLYGGSAIVAFLDDGQEMDKELNYNSIRKVISLKTYDRHQISWLEQDLSQNYYDEYYGEPLVFTITPYKGESFRVHRSRMHIFGGERVPNLEKLYNNYWDDSVLQSAYSAIRNYALSLNASVEIVQDFIQVVIGVEDLTGILAMPDGEQQVINRAKVIDYTRSNCNSVFLDASRETYQKQASSIGGLDGLLDKYLEHICAITGIPMTKFGRAPVGMNATGKSDNDNHDNNVEAYRTDQAAPCINWVINLLKAQLMWKKSERPISYEWQFPSLKPVDELQLAQIRLITAQTDAIYIDRGIPCNFLFDKRYQSTGFFDSDIQIEEKELKQLEYQQENENPEDQALLEDMEEQLETSSSDKVVNQDSNETTYDQLEEKLDSENSEELDDYLDRILHKRIASKING